MATYRTNFFMPNRWALSLRVNPRVLMTAEELEVKVLTYHAIAFEVPGNSLSPVAGGGCTLWLINAFSGVLVG